MIKKGDIFYSVWINVEANLKEKSTVELEELHVTSCNSKGIYLREKHIITWGKLSKTQGDFGWKPLSPSDRKLYTKHFKNEVEVKEKLFSSKSAAYRGVLMEARKYKKDAARILTQVEKSITKHTKKR